MKHNRPNARIIPFRPDQRTPDDLLVELNELPHDLERVKTDGDLACILNSVNSIVSPIDDATDDTYSGVMQGAEELKQ